MTTFRALLIAGAALANLALGQEFGYNLDELATEAAALPQQSAQAEQPVATEQPAGLGGFFAPAQKLVTPSLEANTAAYAEGKPFAIIFKADITSPWHAYYRNPGTVGLPMEATLKAPEGFKVEGPFWKVPTRYEGVTGVAYGYAEPKLVWRVTPEANAPQSADFSVESSIQVCSEEGCMPPESAVTTISLNKGEGEAATPVWDAEQYKDIEVMGMTACDYAVSQTEDAVIITFSSDPVEQAYFFSEDNSISPVAEQKLEAVEGVEGEYRLTLPRNDNSDPMYPVADETQVGKPLAELKGTLRIGELHCPINHVFSAAAAPAAPEKTQDTASIVVTPDGPMVETAETSMTLWALFGSLFLGGLILNLMPCVFPVIGLKIMSFVELGGGSRGKVFAHSLAFVLGILISFWVLSILLIVFSNLEALVQAPWYQWLDVLLTDAGAGTRSWAEWMQNNWVVYLILLLLLVMGLSMYGVFEIGVAATGVGQELQSKKGYTGSFFSGLFVTVVATPCSGPFLGAAMPAAMAQPGLMMVAALTFMALGLASPYIVLGAFPSLVRLLPAPGAWMESLKQGLSVLLFAAAAWFLDIYLAFVPESRMMVIFIALVGVCAAFWVYGRWCPIYRERGSRITGFIIALALLGVSVWYSMPHADDAPAAPETGSASYSVSQGSQAVWNDWSPELMQKALEDGHPVYVDFTAKWCATCQANKKVAYSEEVLALMADNEVVLMKADKTRPNPVIDEEMRRLNRSAVPVNVLYKQGEDPAITRELLTAPYLLEWLSEQL